MEGSSLVAALQAGRSEWDNVGWARFQTACPCGATTLEVLGLEAESTTPQATKIFLAPLALGCRSCHATTELFDPRRDGYGAEIGAPTGKTGRGERVAFACPRCGARAFEIAVSLAYDLDEDDADESEQFASRPQDFFTWFAVTGRCAACADVIAITDYECA